MLKVNNVELRFPTKVLFKNVNLEFNGNNCYGIIGANGAGKSTFLKILDGRIEPTRGEVILGKGERISTLVQNHNEFDEYRVIDTVIMGNKDLYAIMQEKDALYSNVDFTDEDGMRAAELEEKFLLMDGWNAESDAEKLLNGLGLDKSLYENDKETLEKYSKILYSEARLIEGLAIDNPTEISNLICEMISK